MILCVTLNPCLDKTLVVPSWKPGDLVRGVSVRKVVGGKGINVARALRRLGRSPCAVTFVGGPTGAECIQLLREDDKLDSIVVMSESPTRVILTVHTQSATDQTAFFDPDPLISVREAEVLTARVEEALGKPGVQALSLSGSSPSSTTHGLYSELISLAQARKIPVFLDTYGPALEAIWGFWPSVIQLNRREAALQLKQKSVSDRDVLGLLDDWRKHGVTCGVVTDGPDPVLIQFRGKRFRAIPPAIQVLNPIGSGDSFLAGLIDGWLAGTDPEEMIRHAMGCAAANASVWDAGAIDTDQARRFAQEVVLEPV